MRRQRPQYKTFAQAYAELQRRDRRVAQVKALGAAIRATLAAATPKPSAPCSLDAPWIPANSTAANVLDVASVLAEHDGRGTITPQDLAAARVMIADAMRAEIGKKGH